MASALPTPSIPKTYPELRRGVEAVLLAGRQKIEVAWVETYHAKRFVEGLVALATGVTVCTTKPDKYDRYLSDVFFATSGGAEIFLNNALLEKRHAIRKDDFTLYDWDFNLSPVPK